MKLNLLAASFALLALVCCDRNSKKENDGHLTATDSVNDLSKKHVQNLEEILGGYSVETYEFIALDTLGIKMSYAQPKVALRLLESEELLLFDKKGLLIKRGKYKSSAMFEEHK